MGLNNNEVTYRIQVRICNSIPVIKHDLTRAKTTPNTSYPEVFLKLFRFLKEEGIVDFNHKEIKQLIASIINVTPITSDQDFSGNTAKDVDLIILKKSAFGRFMKSALYIMVEKEIISGTNDEIAERFSTVFPTLRKRSILNSLAPSGYRSTHPYPFIHLYKVLKVNPDSSCYFMQNVVDKIVFRRIVK